ncbi:hypothetical protein [Dictyobacter arantiisoli]|uniref:Uncharacterized protein n=1 Tax=Dictyobacter arantiisoli TaxID=2014874 RepID=A0A5A5T880_9CHLR|nr:hypothetical protein [Dictyobacter arantiisoli]GCF07557.1 hypothetical protein KDI_11210 [Dictyobacter arantiisoli]
MSDELSEPMQVELFAASLRATSVDLNAFVEALAAKLSGSLPSQTQVIRHSSLFSREHPVKEIFVALGDYQYRITRERQRPPQTFRAKIVRGIVLKTDLIPMDEWIEELALSLAYEAARSSQTRAALERFLL